MAKRTVRRTPQEISSLKNQRKITALSTYDFPMARLVDEQDIDILLVGDSLGMVLLGYETTQKVTMTEMLHHVRATSRACQSSLVVADMPYGSYETAEKALKNAKKFLKAGANAVKLEGGGIIQKQIKALLKAEIPVMGHLGMLPQNVSQKKGYRVHGRDSREAEAILNDAKLLDRLGVFSFVLECVPRGLAKKITQVVKTPTIGIGAGKQTDGQILVLHDVLGFQGSVAPKFVRRYAQLERTIKRAVRRYQQDVIEGDFPSKNESF